MSSRRRVWAEIDVRALCDNLTLARARLPSHTAVLGVVKADAYGHGAVPISRALAGAGISMLGVGDAHEAIELREAGIDTSILVLGASLESEIPALIRHRVVPSIHSPDRIATFAAAARNAGVRLPVHLLIDTGMSRLGGHARARDRTPERHRERARSRARRCRYSSRKPRSAGVQSRANRALRVGVARCDHRWRAPSRRSHCELDPPRSVPRNVS